MPGITNPTLTAKYLLQKKCWIKVSAAINITSIHFSDFSTVNPSPNSKNSNQNTGKVISA
jgi:hypothetical protein